MNKHKQKKNEVIRRNGLLTRDLSTEGTPIKVVEQFKFDTELIATDGRMEQEVTAILGEGANL